MPPSSWTPVSPASHSTTAAYWFTPINIWQFKRLAVEQTSNLHVPTTSPEEETPWEKPSSRHRAELAFSSKPAAHTGRWSRIIAESSVLVLLHLTEAGHLQVDVLGCRSQKSRLGSFPLHMGLFSWNLEEGEPIGFSIYSTDTWFFLRIIWEGGVHPFS